MGKFKCVMKPGLNFITPIIDSPRNFTWRITQIDSSGRVVDETKTSYRIDLRESIFNFLRVQVYTKDAILLDVNSLMYYRIVDVRKAIYSVEDLQTALSNTAQTQLKEVFGNMLFSQALQSQSKINEHLKTEFDKLFVAWGIEVERMELLDLAPNQNERVTAQAMKKQMIAERTRRGEFIRSEGRKAAMNLKAEGVRVVARTMGIAEQNATRKRSEGKATAAVTLARAERTALETVGAAIKSSGASQVEYMLAQKYLDFFKNMLRNVEQRTVFFPYLTFAVSGLLSSLGSIFGPSAPMRVPRPLPAPNNEVDLFPELGPSM
eukprot:TRINITY_DN272_c0_g1_i3.p1 TRINITY_DN272_c0_g1~~TRINITY_DN272_c0_g1_i3.p1  ORF type:complete len:321 (-),score=142.62 TRINITY_DN272_c0_g1_i3:129-1091(-)